MDRTVVVLDGVAREAKFETSCKRRDISRHSLDKLDRAATKLEQAVAGGRYRMPHAFWQRIDRLKSSCNNVTMEDKQDLEKLLTKAGFEIIIAEGEADVYIGAHALGKWMLCLVVTTHMVAFEPTLTTTFSHSPRYYHICRFGYGILRGRANFSHAKIHPWWLYFQLVKKQQVLERLVLESFALPVLGIVSGNDYVPNVPGLAIRRNVELLKQLQTHQRTSKELLDAYVIATDAGSLGYDFTSAYNVFLEFNEGHNINVDVDDPMDRLDIIERIDRAREQMYLRAATKEEQETEGEESRLCHKESMLETIVDAVHQLQEPKALAGPACQAIIDDALETGRLEGLTTIIVGTHGGSNFSGPLLHLIHGTSGRTKEPLIVRAKEIMDFPPWNHTKFTLTLTISDLSDILDQEMGQQVIGRYDLLKERVLDLVPDAKDDVVAIESEHGLLNASALVRFIKINMLLPESSRWDVVPLSKLRATYIRLSEAALFDILHHNTSFVALMADLAQSTDPRLMKDNLVRSEKGWIVNRLFRFPKSVRRRLALLNDDDEFDAGQRINILHNYILTNGFVVKISVIAKGLRKPPPNSGLVLADLSALDDLESRDVEWVLGVDLGEKCLVGCVSKNPSAPHIVRKVAITTQATNQPNRRFNDWNHRHKDDDQCRKERILTRRNDKASADYLNRFIGGYGVARRYYREKSYLRMEWDAKKASKGEWDMVINKMLEMVDCTIGRKVQDGRNVVVAFGTGEFESKKSRHTAFLKYFVNRVSSLGLRIVGVDEYFTSKKCPRCGLFVEMMTLRSLYCRGCHMYYHRDEMAGENIVNVVMEYVKSGDRPEYLQPPPPPSSQSSRKTTNKHRRH
ncbi:hypothetical protein SeLEV6574_g08300 [Synchytrium endobioticum]|uniref:Cas12f1-like TNB domain-containing protein n=1 Tax=Synchytrium endobioticum TaxID=286115 RepID=A0A507C583_9FUNG|nr:hypothetical protein SeLEV6574_g08300 [Synchytrium endobioticum]